MSLPYYLRRAAVMHLLTSHGLSSYVARSMIEGLEKCYPGTTKRAYYRRDDVQAVMRTVAR